MSSDKKIAIVTGGAQGIGKSISTKLSNMGCKVIIVDVNEEVASNTASELEGDYYIADVRNFEQVGGIVDEIIEKDGKIDILINNAGITRDNLLIRMEEEEWDQVIDINLKGVFNFSKQVLKKSMMKQRAGSIVNIASIIGVMGNPGQANYSASKGGVIALTKTMAKEFSKRNIRVNAVAPGFIQTSMTDKLPESVKEKYLQVIPLGRLGTSDEVAEVVNFLVSESSSYVTGQVINIDGGMVM